MAEQDRAVTVPSPSGNVDAVGNPLHVLHEDFLQRLQPTMVGEHLSQTEDVHVFELRPDEGRSAVAHVVYVRLGSAEWEVGSGSVERTIDAVHARVHSRDEAVSPTLDGAASSSSPAAGYYVSTGSATRGQHRTATLPRGTRKVGGGVNRTAPYRHRNYRDPQVQRVCNAAAPLMGAAAAVLRRHVPHVYRSMWEHVQQNPLVGSALIYPSPCMQDGGSQHEFEPRPKDMPQGPSIPTQHVAVRVAGAREGASTRERVIAAMGVSDHHVDSMDSASRHGHPIVFVPCITPSARLRGGNRMPHPLPSSDLVLGEGSCRAARGDRAWRIVVCKDGWVCIVVAHYERLMHGNVYPCGRSGAIMDREGVPFLARSPSHMPAGVQLLRLVCYCTTSLDTFAEEVQNAWEACVTWGQRQALAQRIWRALDAPLDARFLVSLRECIWRAHAHACVPMASHPM